MSNLEAKKKYWKKVYDNAPMIECACGCGESIKSKDKYGRDKKYISGHNGRKYEDSTQYKREWNHRNRDKRYQYKVKRSKELKVKLIKQKGSKCINCNLEYNGKNASKFDFHHIDPNTKEFALNQHSLQTKSLDAIDKEVAKCNLICSNCHRMIHSKEY